MFFIPILFWVSIGIVCLLTGCILFSFVYHRYLYKRWYRTRFDKNYTPRCAVIVPCKNIPQNFKENVQSFLNQAYPSFKMIYAVESETDPSVPILKKAIAQNKNARLVFAGITKECCQKNYNLLAAVEEASDCDVYVFADSDIIVGREWLSELVLPLSNKKITVTTGFRWLYSSTGSMGGTANAYQNFLIFVFFSLSSFLRNFGLWGGSMAIRKDDFEALRVRDYWSHTVVDDISLSRLVLKNNKKSLIVSTCIIASDDALPTLRHSVKWFQRQVMFLKAYQKFNWSLLIGIMGVGVFLQVVLPVMILGTYLIPGVHTMGGLKAATIFFVGMFINALLYKLLGNMPKGFRFMLYQPISLFTVFLGSFRTVFTNSIDWSGFRYTFNRQGKVVSVVRKSSG